MIQQLTDADDERGDLVKQKSQSTTMKAILLLLLTLAFITTKVHCQCWQNCYDNDSGRHYYTNWFWKASREIKRLANKHDVHGIAFLLDTTLRKDLPATMNNIRVDGDRLFQYQKDIAAIFAFMATDMGANPYYMIQFNEEKAWGCTNHQSLDACGFSAALDQATSMEYYTDKNEGHGRLEAACKLSNYYWDESSLGGDLMALVMANGHMHEPTNYRPQPSWCEDFFRTKLAIGTHSSSDDDMDDWQLSKSDYYKIRDKEENIISVANFRSCIQRACCHPAPFIDDSGTCLQTDGTHKTDNIVHFDTIEY